MEAAMNSMLTKRERLILTNPADPRVVPANDPRIVKQGTPWNRIVTALRDPELVAIVMLCAIGLLVTAAFLLTFPDFGEISQSYQQFL
jgi:hypothetical protein